MTEIEQNLDATESTHQVDDTSAQVEPTPQEEIGSTLQSEEELQKESPEPAETTPTEEESQDEAPATAGATAIEEEPLDETPKTGNEDPEPRTREGMSWFVLRVASNKEDFVRNALEKKVQIEAVQHLVGRIMVPTEKTKTLTKNNKVKITETKLYPGYIFVEMKLVDTRISQDVFFLIKDTTGVGDFVGTAGKPTPMSNEEVDKMLYDSQAPEEVTEVKLEFAKGDHVNVKDGPFMGYEGTVDEIFPEKGVVRVLATVFGRQTQIDIEYWMVEKAE